MDALSFDLMKQVNIKGTAREIWESIKRTFCDSSTWDDGKFKEDEPKKVAHEDIEHDHNLVIVEDCSTSWSSDDDDQSTTSSLDKIDDASSDALDDPTPCTLDGDDGSCSRTWLWCYYKPIHYTTLLHIIRWHQSIKC